ncbi:MAG TPA: hypothetical protein VLR26_00020 [Frankiaceae bacterium]|nr:hypothetical protein [Frankiaceae bacterium]
MEELAGLLNRERLLLELLLFKLVSLRQLLLAGEVRFLPWAAKEVDRATTKVREAELRRALTVEGLSISRQQETDAELKSSVTAPAPMTLRTLAESAPEPWRTIFAEHRAAFLELAAALEDAISATRRLAISGGAAIGTTLDRLSGAVPAQAGPSAGRSPTASTHGPRDRCEPAAAKVVSTAESMLDTLIKRLGA